MKHYTLSIFMFVVSSVAIPETTVAQKNQSSSIPKIGFRAEYLKQLDEVSKKIIDLAQAVPKEKYPWRPAEGVRSISEVYLHIARSNYFLLRFAGIALPKDLDLGNDASVWEKSTIEKARIIETLKRSLDHVRQAVLNTSDSDIEKPIKMFGRDTTIRDAFFNTALHQHEHLGQSIAYARMNRIVPPWTAQPQPNQE